MIQNRLLQSFLKDEKVFQIYEEYKKKPSNQIKETLEKMFQIHVRKIQLLSYFSRVLYFESQRYDQKVRQRNSFCQLILDKDLNEDDVRMVDMIPVSNDFQVATSTDAACLEEFFEDEKLCLIIYNLTPKQKNIIHALFLENQTESEVAENLGVTKQAVNKVKNQTLKKIKQEYMN